MNRIPGFIIIILLIFSSPVMQAQENTRDERILIADTLCQNGQYEEAIDKYLDYIGAHGKIKEEEKPEMAEINSNVAFCYYKLDSFTEAINWFDKALQIQREVGDQETAANLLNNIGLCYKMLGNYDIAIDYYMETVMIDEKLGNSISIAKTFNNIGLIYRAWGKYDKAIEYLEKSLRLKKDLNDQAGVSKSLNNIGLVYNDWKKFDEALLNFREALKIEESLQNISEMAIRYNNIGIAYFFRKENDSALYYFIKSKEIHTSMEDIDQIAMVNNNIGKVYAAQMRYSEAIPYLSNSLKIYNELKIEPEKATVLANLSDYYHKTGNSAKALQLLDSSLAIALRLNMRNQIKQDYEYFSTIYSDLKDFEKSLDYYKKFTALKDSVFTREILTQLSDFQIKYEKEKDQARILALEKENLLRTNQRNAYMFTVLGIVVIALFVTFYFRQRAHHIRIISNQKIRQLEEEKKLMAAKLLIEGQEVERKRIATELHDGLGVLLSATKMQFSVIRDKSPENTELIQKATRMLEQAAGDVRKISHNMMPGLLTKLGFFEAVEDLFEKIHDTSGLNAICTITGDQERLAENKEIMLYRIVQEMVNNSLKHANAGTIELQIDINPGTMDLIYTDDGKGFDFSQKIQSESIGLKSLQSRTGFLNGKLDIKSSPGHGVKYSFQIPI